MEVSAGLLAYGQALTNFQHMQEARSVIAGAEKFFSKPSEYKGCWTITDFDNPDDPYGLMDGPDDGYVLKNGEKRHIDDKRYDVKEFFHLKPGTLALLRQQGVDVGEEASWLASATHLHSLCTLEFLRIVRGLDVALPQYKLFESALRATVRGQNTLRFLKYRTAEKLKQEIAKFHSDRNFLTLHIGDSMPGLAYEDREGKVVEYTVEPGKILVFPGMKAEKVLGEKLPRLKHGVLAHPDAIGLRRWALVFFGHTDIFLTAEDRKRLAA